MTAPRESRSCSSWRVRCRRAWMDRPSRSCFSTPRNHPKVCPSRVGASGEASSSSATRWTAAGVLDDHTPFIQAGVPAVDLIDFDYGPGPSPGAWWHTRDDDLGHVCARSLGAVGAPALAALPGIR